MISLGDSQVYIRYRKTEGISSWQLLIFACAWSDMFSLCHAGVNIGGKAGVPSSIFFSLLWNYFVQVAFHLILIVYYATCMACYRLTVYIVFILNSYMCMLSGCIPSHVGLVWQSSYETTSSCLRGVQRWRSETRLFFTFQVIPAKINIELDFSMNWI